MSANHGELPPILAQKHYNTPSAFTPESLLREARRQKRITGTSIPAICILDPDGDMVRSLIACGHARLEPAWGCYHTQLFSFSRGEIDFGIVGRRRVCSAHRRGNVRVGLQIADQRDILRANRASAPTALFHPGRSRCVTKERAITTCHHLTIPMPTLN